MLSGLDGDWGLGNAVTGLIGMCFSLESTTPSSSSD